MLKNTLKKTAMYFLIFIGAYLIIGYLLHAVIFPEKKPEIATYFKPGDEFYSKTEKVRQTVVKQENGYVYCTAAIEPFAPGPPEHVHTDFDEVFEITNGELSILVNGEVKKLHAGEQLLIRKGTPHKPFNETNETIYTKGMIAFPEKFAFHLSQVYGLMDNDPTFGKSAATMLQMSILNHSGFDSYLAGPPLMMQHMLSFVLTPATRLFGYKSYYPEYDTKRHASAIGARINE
jgi:mannose-6-phosphate isomerase-like protein (cupin superfamily)